MAVPVSLPGLKGCWYFTCLAHLDGVKISSRNVSSCINFHLSSGNSTAYYKHYSLQHLCEVERWVILLPPFESCRNWVIKRSQRTVQGHVSSAWSGTWNKYSISALSSSAISWLKPPLQSSLHKFDICKVLETFSYRTLSKPNVLLLLLIILICTNI